MPGHVAWEPGQPAEIGCDESLARVAELVREFHDLAHVCWQYVHLGDGVDAGDAARAIRLICDAYGLADRRGVVDVILWWQARCWRGIEAGASAGDPAMAGLRGAGAVREVQAAYRWVAEHHRELMAGLA